ncbi:DUF1622 domain-containing protein [Hymenobacter sp. BT175]|uniref:DUF1622 domain-containing protein n=1 Tax=Hymenobacter translucens TaxID=2886507 RepID=UPI001D0DF608|nr:DUF1622 domain-containing protein [Hymenobacter translucens]MCC2547614.1 DUF1622 domain-containing protein [Hymenobacter translucens]
MEEFIKTATLRLTQLVEAAAAIVIVVASVRALLGFLISLIRKKSRRVPSVEIRLALGQSLALALELELGADILKTAVAPTWNDIAQLAAIAVLRTALNYFLEKELRDAETRKSATDQPTDTGRGNPQA